MFKHPFITYPKRISMCTRRAGPQHRINGGKENERHSSTRTYFGQRQDGIPVQSFEDRNFTTSRPARNSSNISNELMVSARYFPRSSAVFFSQPAGYSVRGYTQITLVFPSVSVSSTYAGMSKKSPHKKEK
jgi:hypothetical protein